MSKIVVHSENLASAIQSSNSLSNSIFSYTNAISKFKEEAIRITKSWPDQYCEIHRGKPYCALDKSGFYYDSYDSNGNKTKTFDTNSYNSASKEKAKEWIRQQVDKYIGIMNECFNKLPDPYNDANSVATSLKNLETARYRFDNYYPNIVKVYNDLNVGGEDGEGTGFSFKFEYVIDEKTGKGVVHKVLSTKSESGKTIYLNEAVNCSVSTVGQSSDYVVTVASVVANGQKTPKEINNILKNGIVATASANQNLLEKGYYSISSKDDVAFIYKDVFGKEYDEETVMKDYQSLLTYFENTNDEEAEYLTALAAGGVGVVAPFVYNYLMTHDMTDEELEKAGLGRLKDARHKDDKKEDDEEGLTSEFMGANHSHDLLGEGQYTIHAGLGTESFEPSTISGRLLDELPLNDEQIEELSLGIGEELGTPTEELGTRSKIELETISELDLPKKIEDVSLSSTDIDAKTTNDYYEQFKSDTIGQDRGQLIEQYNAMTPQEKVSALQDLGYQEDVITDIVTNGTAGVTAYVIGQQNLQMTNLSNQIAMQQGNLNLGTNDSSAYFTNISSDLAAPSMQVQQARTSLNGAKMSYDNAITYANSAIDEANDIKNEYNAKVQAIKSRSGDNPNNWSDEDIEEYNKITNKYNKAVEKANTAASRVENEKDNYEKRKAAYEAAKKKLAEEANRNVQENLNNSTNFTGTIVETPVLSGNNPEVSTNISESIESGIVTEEGALVSKPTQISQTMTGIGENGELVTETRVTDVMASDLNGVTVDGVSLASSQTPIQTNPNTGVVNTGNNLGDMQQMQQYATIVTEQEARREVNQNNNNITPDLVGVTVQ
ncbi:MAG TPA: hypothetical protein DCE23_00095 [Firmicutes bacterium]|nr:hypothetical protein [Bacillota bacterium]